MACWDVSLPGETWKAAPGLPEGFYVSDLGRLFSPTRGLLSPPLDDKGYPRTTIAGKARRLHLLVIEAFHGPRPPGHQAAHLNGNASDARASNLAWCTPTENSLHKQAHGTMARGEMIGIAKLTDKKVIDIRNRYRRGESWLQIAAAVGVGKTAVKKAALGQTWSHVPEPVIARSQSEGLRTSLTPERRRLKSKIATDARYGRLPTLDAPC